MISRTFSLLLALQSLAPCGALSALEQAPPGGGPDDGAGLRHPAHRRPLARSHAHAQSKSAHSRSHGNTAQATRIVHDTGAKPHLGGNGSDGWQTSSSGKVPGGDAAIGGTNETHRPHRASAPLTKIERTANRQAARAQNAAAAKAAKARAARRNKWSVARIDWTAVIVSSSGLLDTTLNWLHHFAALNLSMPLVLICEDKALAEEKDKALKKYSKLLDMKVVRAGGASEEEKEHYFGSDGYNKIVSRRGYHLQGQLKQGKNIIYSDVDTVWVKDPRPWLLANANHPRQLWGAPGWNGYHKEICTGFLAVRSSPETMQLMKMWGDALTDGQDRNQPMFNEILTQKLGGHGVWDVGVLREENFPRGDQYFLKQRWNRKAAVVVHASWIKGNDEKIKAFRSQGLWDPS